MSKSSHFSLSFKILFFVVCYVLGISVMWFMSNDDMHTAGKKFTIMERAYLLDNIILEVRRYEKNYLLYDTPEALKEHREYIAKAEQTADYIHAQIKNLKATPLLNELELLIKSYKENFSGLEKSRVEGSSEYDQLLHITRDLGKQMTEKSAQLLEFERVQLHVIFQELKTRMSLLSAVAIILGIIMPFVTFFKIFRPLNIIKKTTGAIAQGHFKRVEVLNTRDEMQQVMEAFNTMVQELELRQDQLVQSQKLSSIGTLTAGVAHQLNNPLNNISTSCQIALAEIDAGDKDLFLKMLNNIDQETLRARDVVKGLLEFSRSEKFSIRTASLLDIVNRAVRLARSEVAADIQVKIDVPDSLMVPMDVQRMQEVFLNLILNAAQAIEQKGVITLSSEIDEKEDAVIIIVHDTGPGIPKEIQGQLFDPFYTTKEEGKGTGLGLSVVYGIIQKHHGEISVSSEPGQGASFYLRLPLSPGKESSIS
ncbi:sensor histidine kinase [Desulfosediminicola flagellatus]|uniref:sensor histidine kinase n=1 Tax=Desulfosediminicola flagellatus TaxID=2569541 RepID=UPI0010AD5585|nr:HAMP domain-containing sensor histidine kinase [Desulfosediminicola flagellatus]